MFRKILFTLAVVFASSALVFSQGSLKGKIFDKDTDELLPFVNIIIESGGKQVGGASTDFDGVYLIKPIPPGTYTIKASYMGYHKWVMTGVVISNDKIVFVNVPMVSELVIIEDEVIVIGYKIPLIDPDNTSVSETKTAAQIQKMPSRSVGAVVATAGGVFSEEGKGMSIRGSRSTGTVTYVDGVKVQGSSNLPPSAIEQISVIMGGLPAKYGDATGGVINVTTKGPSRKFYIGGELISSEGFDKYGYNSTNFVVNGPILKDKRDTVSGTALLGYFISGSLTSSKDSRPFHGGLYKVKDDVLNEIRENPLTTTGFGGYSTFQTGQFINASDLESIDTRQNCHSYSTSISGKIDVKTNESTSLAFGGTFNRSWGSNFSYSNYLLNSENNGYSNYTDYRLWGRFTQKFLSGNNDTAAIKNIYYSVQADFSKTSSNSFDKNHQDNLFNYGYVGKFKTHKMPAYADTSFADHILGKTQVGWMNTLYEFDTTETNPINQDLYNYTKRAYGLFPFPFSNKEIAEAGGALLNGSYPESIYGLWTSPGVPYNSYGKSNRQQIAMKADGSADINNHAIEFGLGFEQRISRSVGYSPAGLWTVMRQQVNKHILERDLANPIYLFDDDGIFLHSVSYNRKYSADEQSFIDYNLRQHLGLDVDGTDWIDVDNLSPSEFSIEMFSADELLRERNGQLVSYFGYDHLGNKLSSKPSLDDFFTEKDDFGNYTRKIGAFEPIYTYAYIQDKFSFEDLIFNIGIRVDRYDANQPVLKDPYLLFDAKTVKEVDEFSHPSSMGDDYVVYVDDINNPGAIKGYRNGDVWYNEEGSELADPEPLTTASGIAPYLVDPDNDEVTSAAFKDYEPQITLQPRIAFSFPVSLDALFYANYTVLSSRPYANQFNPLDYLYIENLGMSSISNPNLKPERNVEYELGFQQVIGPSSALKIQAYYKDMRDQVASFRYTMAYPYTYISYKNVDFGTVKGMTVTYDLRQTKNIWMQASYTLQFANGTGSSANSSLAFVRAGLPNLKTINPLSYDRRHNVAVTVDYRFSGGKDYNGPAPKFVKKDGTYRTIGLLENTGINFTFTGGSGTPYTKHRKTGFAGGSQYINGSINGSNMDWVFKIDARIDRDFDVKFGKDENKKTSRMTVYFQILNVLNIKNVVRVYGATGNADDDGYLSAAEYQESIANQASEQSFRDLYDIYIDNPYNYYQPRRIRLGVQFSL